MDRYQERLNRVKSPPALQSVVDLEKATPQELRWNQLTGAARTDTKLKELLSAFTGACASARLHAVNSGADYLAVIDRLGEMNIYLREEAKKPGLCVDNLHDLPPIHWDGYQKD